MKVEIKFNYIFCLVLCENNSNKKNSVFRFQEKKVFWDLNIKLILWKVRILNPKNAEVIYL